LRVKLWPVTLGGGNAPDSRLGPGELRLLRDRAAGDRVFTGTATTPIELGEVQPDGKRRMRAADWARGLHRNGQPAVLG
jgi:methionyl-tRNA formyltransferase